MFFQILYNTIFEYIYRELVPSIISQSTSSINLFGLQITNLKVQLNAIRTHLSSRISKIKVAVKVHIGNIKRTRKLFLSINFGTTCILSVCLPEGCLCRGANKYRRRLEFFLPTPLHIWRNSFPNDHVLRKQHTEAQPQKFY